MFHFLGWAGFLGLVLRSCYPFFRSGCGHTLLFEDVAARVRKAAWHGVKRMLSHIEGLSLRLSVARKGLAYKPGRDGNALLLKAIDAYTFCYHGGSLVDAFLDDSSLFIILELSFKKKALEKVTFILANRTMTCDFEVHFAGYCCYVLSLARLY